MRLNRARWALGVLAGAALLLATARLPDRAGMTAIYVLLGVIPGAALTLLFRPATRLLSAIVLGLAIGPLASGLAGWGLLALGVPIRIAFALTAGAGLAMLAAARPAPAEVRNDAAELSLSPSVFLGALLAVLVIAPPLFNPWISMRGDAWTHSGIVWQIAERGVPAAEPRFGIPCHYVDPALFLAMMSAARAMRRSGSCRC
jgi:hypothetical protein